VTTPEERRKRLEHHVVHDFANLVSSGLLITNTDSNNKLLAIAPVNSHVWHAFYMNCRKMFEFFKYGQNDRYVRARECLTSDINFPFNNWNYSVQKHMEGHLLHVGGDRTEGQISWTGASDRLYLFGFQEAWRLMMGNLKTEHKKVFREEIDHRLDSEFRHCGDLGRQFIL